MSSQAIELGPVRSPSALVRLTRWSLLLTGVWFGYRRWHVLHAREEEQRAYNARMAPVWEAEAAIQKAKKNREELLVLAKEAGVPVKSDF